MGIYLHEGASNGSRQHRHFAYRFARSSGCCSKIKRESCGHGKFDCDVIFAPVPKPKISIGPNRPRKPADCLWLPGLATAAHETVRVQGWLTTNYRDFGRRYSNESVGLLKKYFLEKPHFRKGLTLFASQLRFLNL